MSLSLIRQALSGTRTKRFVLIALATVGVALVVFARYANLVGGVNQRSLSAPDRYETDYAKALELLARGDYRLSIKAFEEVDVQRDHACAACRNNIGVALMRLGQPDIAEKHFLVAAGLQPDVELYRNNLAWSRRTAAP